MSRSFDYVGDNSTFQKRITCILLVQWIAFSLLVNTMSIGYFFRTPKFECKLIPLTNIFIPCSEAVACSLPAGSFKPVFAGDESTNSYFHNQYSIVQEFELYCSRSQDPIWAQTVFFLGSFIGGYLFSFISNRKGRRYVNHKHRPILMIGILMTIGSIVMCACAWNFDVFIVGYFLAGITIFGYETSVEIYIADISAPRFRNIAMNVLTTIWAGTPIVLPLLSLVPTWRQSYFVLAAVELCTLPFAYRCFLESPRFLLTKKCIGQIKEIFQVVSVTNKRPAYRFRLMDEIDLDNRTFAVFKGTEKREVSRLFADGELEMETPEVKKYNFADLFSYRSLRTLTIILMFWRFLQFTTNFTLNLALEGMFKSDFLLTWIIALAAFAEVLGSFAILTTFCFRHKKLDLMTTAIGVLLICCISLAFLPLSEECSTLEGNKFCLTVGLVLLIILAFKFFNTLFLTGLNLYSLEAFPTPVRSLGYGLTVTFGRLGTIIVPSYIKYVKTRFPEVNALAFFTPLLIVGIFLCKLLHNTEDEGMKEKIDEERES